MDIETISKLAQASFAGNPVLVLGSGCSAPHGLPSMNALKDHLLSSVIANGNEEEDAWLLVRTALSNGDHLEQALTGKVLPSSLTTKVVLSTWQCVASKDKDVFFRALTYKESFPLGTLVKALFQSSQRTIEIVTTNYDRVAEYALNAQGIAHSTGFTPGYIQEREGADPIHLYRSGRLIRTVRIWKVHGSLDWFERKDGTAVSAPLFENPDPLMMPLIVTPGFNKYERTHNEPFRSAIQGADRALENAEAYVCIGFGFRDSHVEPKIIERCRKKGIPVVVLAHTLTNEAKTFLKSRAGEKYLGIEACGSGSKAYTYGIPDGFEIPNKEFWSLNGYLNLVT